jgi:hypothetical protein
MLQGNISLILHLSLGIKGRKKACGSGIQRCGRKQNQRYQAYRQ